MTTPIEKDLALAIEKMPLLSTILPYNFGGSVIDQIEVTCASCGAELESDTIRGSIETMANEHAAHLNAYALCFKCKTITPIVSKFHDDGTVLIKLNNGWVKDIWTTRKRGVLDDVAKYVRQK